MLLLSLFLLLLLLYHCDTTIHFLAVVIIIVKDISAAHDRRSLRGPCYQDIPPKVANCQLSIHTEKHLHFNLQLFHKMLRRCIDS